MQMPEQRRLYAEKSQSFSATPFAQNLPWFFGTPHRRKPLSGLDIFEALPQKYYTQKQFHEYWLRGLACSFDGLRINQTLTGIRVSAHFYEAFLHKILHHFFPNPLLFCPPIKTMNRRIRREIPG
jgi:hypothetical protein